MKLTESSPPHSIGVVGLGSMGAPIAAHLAARGFEVRGHDLSAEAMRRAEAHRVIPAQRIDDLTSADVVLLFVPSDEDVLDVGATLTAILRSGAIIGVCSSVRPETCRLLGERAGAQGVAVVDGALTGGVRAAEAGTIRLLAGGDAAVIEALDPLFAAFCSAVAVLGPLGAGQAGKTVNNLLH